MRSQNVTWDNSAVSRRQRWSALGRSGATIWLTGLPAAGKSTLAAAVERRLIERRRSAYLLDSPVLRQRLTADLGHSVADRRDNARRLAEVARLFADSGTIAIVASISPFATDRQHARTLHAADGLPFVEVFLNTPLALCIERDPHGIYQRAIDRALAGVPGIDQRYERPHAPDVEITPNLSRTTAVEHVLAALER